MRSALIADAATLYDKGISTSAVAPNSKDIFSSILPKWGVAPGSISW